MNGRGAAGWARCCGFCFRRERNRQGKYFRRAQTNSGELIFLEQTGGRLGSWLEDAVKTPLLGSF